MTLPPVLRLLLLASLLLPAAPTAAAFATPPPPAATNELTIDEFLALTPRAYRERTGERLGLTGSIALKMAQRKMRRQQKRNSKPYNGERNGLAIAGFVCGILSLIFLPFMSVLAIIFSAIGLSRSNRYGAPHRGLAIAGLVMGIVSIVVSTLIFVVLLAAFT